MFAAIVRSEDLPTVDPGGIEVATATVSEFKDALCTNRHTLKRALTDARYLSGIGGAFADEILQRDDPLLSAVVRHGREDTDCEV